MKKVLTCLLCVILTASFAFSFPVGSFAAIVTETVNVPNFSRNMSGPGYEWNNRTRTLTLTDLHIITTDWYGLKVPDGCTVILNGKNRIEASYAALATEGEVTFKGDGSLELTAGTYGIYGYGTNKGRVTRFMGVSLTVSAGEAAVKYDYEGILFETGSHVSLQTEGENALAIDGVQIKILDSVFSSNAPLSASQQLVIQNSDVLVSTTSQALQNVRSFSMDCVRLSAGSSEAELTETDQYQNQAVLKTMPTGRAGRTSLLFGDGVPAFVDYLILAGVLACVACLIVFPIVRQKKKDRAAREAYEKSLH